MLLEREILEEDKETIKGEETYRSSPLYFYLRMAKMVLPENGWEILSEPVESTFFKKASDRPATRSSSHPIGGRALLFLSFDFKNVSKGKIWRFFYLCG